MKYRRLWALALVVLFAIACQDNTTVSPTSNPSTGGFALHNAATEARISARGTIQPAQVLQLSFRAGGTVRSVAAQVGVEVQAGGVLVELDTTSLEFELQKARENVAFRQAALDGLEGPKAVLVERAEAENTQQVAQAEIALRMAQWRLEQARLQSQAPAVALAQANLQQLDQQIAQDQAIAPTAEVTIAEVDLARAQDALAAAQAEYQKALDRPWEPQDVRDAYARAVQQAEGEVQKAQAQLEAANSNWAAHGFSLSALAAQRDAVEAQLARSLNDQAAYSLTLKLLAAEVDLAQLQLDGLRAWQNPYLDPLPPEGVAQARTLLRQAELSVDELEWQLQGAQLRAPFDGVVSSVPVRVGEWAAPGQTAVELLDVSRWRVETKNVGELQIGRVRVGQEALVRVNAFQDEVLRGRVAAISPVAVVQQGDTTYTLTIELEPTELNLRPGMTAQVEILTE
jgi:HlyD family secretion protein